MDIINYFINYNLAKTKTIDELSKELLDLIELEIRDISKSDKLVDFEKLLSTCEKVVAILKSVE